MARYTVILADTLGPEVVYGDRHIDADTAAIAVSLAVAKYHEDNGIYMSEETVESVQAIYVFKGWIYGVEFED